MSAEKSRKDDAEARKRIKLPGVKLGPMCIHRRVPGTRLALLSLFELRSVLKRYGLGIQRSVLCIQHTTCLPTTSTTFLTHFPITSTLRLSFEKAFVPSLPSVAKIKTCYQSRVIPFIMNNMATDQKKSFLSWGTCSLCSP